MSLKSIDDFYSTYYYKKVQELQNNETNKDIILEYDQVCKNIKDNVLSYDDLNIDEIFNKNPQVIFDESIREKIKDYYSQPFFSSNNCNEFIWLNNKIDA